MDWFIDGLKRYADFTGRSHRTAFWMFILIAWVLSIVIGVVDSFLTGGLLASYSLSRYCSPTSPSVHDDCMTLTEAAGGS